MEQEKSNLRQYFQHMYELQQEENNGPPTKKLWWEDDQLYVPITEQKLTRNEYLNPDKPVEEQKPYEPVEYNSEKVLT